jgi:hypothetical protein
MSAFGANWIWSGWEDLLNRSKMTQTGYFALATDALDAQHIELALDIAEGAIQAAILDHTRQSRLFSDLGNSIRLVVGRRSIWLWNVWDLSVAIASVFGRMASGPQDSVGWPEKRN